MNERMRERVKERRDEAVNTREHARPIGKLGSRSRPHRKAPSCRRLPSSKVRTPVHSPLSSRPSLSADKSENGEAYQRKRAAAPDQHEGPAAVPASAPGTSASPSGSSWRRITLLILAITIHNIPGEDRGAAPPAGPALQKVRLERGPGSWGVRILF